MNAPALKPTPASRQAAHRTIEFVASHVTHTGEVKWFSTTLNYGYIAIAPSLKLELGIGMEFDLYVNAADIDPALPYPRSLEAGQKVTFTISRGTKGWRAANVKVVR